MLSIACIGIGVIDGLIAVWCQKLRLRHFRPVGKVRGLAAVHFAHFLQADDVGIELLYGQSQVVNFQPARGPQALHTFVNVVGGHTQNTLLGGHQEARGRGFHGRQWWRGLKRHAGNGRKTGR